MDLASAVQSAHKQHQQSQSSSTTHQTQSSSLPSHSISTPPLSPTSPTSQLKKTTTNTSTRSVPRQRPSHRSHSSFDSPARSRHRGSQANFDWFGDHNNPSSSLRSDSTSPSGNHRNGNGNATPQLNLPSNKKKGKQPATTPFVDSPAQRSEDENEPRAPETAPEPPPSAGLRGAFTAEDKMRGARAFKGMENEKAGRGGDQGHADGAVDTRGKATTFKDSVKAKAKSIKAPTISGETADEGEWEDENRDQFDQGAPAKKGSGDKPRKGSLWGGLTGKAAVAGESSGTSTPDNGSDAETSGGERKARPSPGARRGSAWGVVRSKLVKEKPAKKKAGEALTGHELIAVRPPFFPSRCLR